MVRELQKPIQQNDVVVQNADVLQELNLPAKKVQRSFHHTLELKLDWLPFVYVYLRLVVAVVVVEVVAVAVMIGVVVVVVEVVVVVVAVVMIVVVAVVVVVVVVVVGAHGCVGVLW